MAVRELRSWLISCDRCPTVYGVVNSPDFPPLPPEWSRDNVTNCGATGYTRTDVLCPECTRKANDTVKDTRSPRCSRCGASYEMCSGECGPHG